MIQLLLRGFLEFVMQGWVLSFLVSDFKRHRLLLYPSLAHRILDAMWTRCHLKYIQSSALVPHPIIRASNVEPGVLSEALS